MEEFNIPEELDSCHTSVITIYAVVGHVPIEAIEKILRETPDIDGISLPTMSAGAPGMAGDKESPFEIFSFKNGISKGIYLTL